jgi:hypothetical protein
MKIYSHYNDEVNSRVVTMSHSIEEHHSIKDVAQDFINKYSKSASVELASEEIELRDSNGRKIDTLAVLKVWTYSHTTLLLTLLPSSPPLPPSPTSPATSQT